ncbi:MAG: hypothetical protein Q9204_000839 [Flavoplaca sp. TL-2023a]
MTNYSRESQPCKHVQTTSPSTSVNDVEPIQGFDHIKTKAQQYRPFHNKAHVKTRISRVHRNEWIEIDWDYLQRIERRKVLLNTHRDLCIGWNEPARLAIRELYEEVMINQLPKRFPQVFSIRQSEFSNGVTSCQYSVKIADLSEDYMLAMLSENVEEDFYFMCPMPTANIDFKRLLSSAKMGLSVREIHQPVPGYEDRLGNGVERHFKRMKAGDFVARLNWSTQTDGDELFKPLAKNTGDPDAPSTPLITSDGRETIDLAKTYLHCERHTLTCLPRTKTIMFCVRTYLTPIQHIKDEGDGGALADACDSMAEKLGVYKRRAVWGKQLCKWLRADHEGKVDGV